MRFVFTIVAMAGMAALGYMYGPELLQSLNQDTSVSQADILMPASPDEHAAPVVEEMNAVSASLNHLKGSVPPATKLPTKTKQRTTAIKAPSAAPKVAQRQETAKIDSILPSQAKPQAVLEKPSSRWIPELSGTRAKLTMGKTRDDDGCAMRNACERKPAPKDISLAGVVVKNDKLLKKPTAPLEGRVMRGNFVDETPAVYVE